MALQSRPAVVQMVSGSASVAGSLVRGVRQAVGGTVSVVGNVGCVAGNMLDGAGDVLDATAGALGGTVVLVGDVLDATGHLLGSTLNGLGNTLTLAGGLVSGTPLPFPPAMPRASARTNGPAEPAPTGQTARSGTGKGPGGRRAPQS